MAVFFYARSKSPRTARANKSEPFRMTLEEPAWLSDAF